MDIESLILIWIFDMDIDIDYPCNSTQCERAQITSTQPVNWGTPSSPCLWRVDCVCAELKSRRNARCDIRMHRRRYSGDVEGLAQFYPGRSCSRHSLYRHQPPPAQYSRRPCSRSVSHRSTSRQGQSRNCSASLLQKRPSLLQICMAANAKEHC